MSDNMVSGTFYIVVGGKRQEYGPKDPETGERPVTSLHPGIKARVGRPNTLRKDEIAVKIRISLPASVFDQITPSVAIEIPEHLILERQEIEAEVEEPDA